MSKILFVAPNSFVVRNWIASGLTHQCRSELGLTPIFVTTLGDAHFQGCQVTYENHTLTESSSDMDLPTLLRLARTLRLRLFAVEFENGSYQMMDLSSREDWLNGMLRLFSRLQSRRGYFRRLLRTSVLHYRPVLDKVDCLFRENDIEMVIVGSPGVQILDHLLMLGAQKYAVPVHCVVSSWDNLTSRGPVMAYPQSLMVWNRHMAAQAQAIHRFPADRVHVVGALQFTPYGEPVTQAETGALYAQIGINLGDPYFLYMSAQHAAEYEIEDVTALSKVIRSSRYADIPILVRCHPQADQAAYKVLEDLPGVRVQRAPKFADSAVGKAEFTQVEVRRMAAQIHNATAIFASWGTTALLEAAIFDRPSVQLRWMDSVPHARPDQRKRVEQFQRYLHLQPFDASGSRQFCDDPASLEAVLDDLFCRAEHHRQNRARAVQELTSLPLALTPQRIVDILKQMSPVGNTSW